MDTKILFQPPFAEDGRSFEDAITAVLEKEPCSKLSVAVAYSSVAGVSRLRDLLEAYSPDASCCWLLGIDDYITQPGAIRLCQTVPNSEVRIYSSTGGRTRFHPKVYLFEPGGQAEGTTSFVGSSNLTYAALRNNCEVNVRNVAKSLADAKELQDSFANIWSIGQSPTPQLLKDYQKQFDRHFKQRRFLQDPGPAPHDSDKPRRALESDSTLMSPENADVCWIEVGKATAQGRELEFKAEQIRFFGLPPEGGPPAHRKFLVSNGEEVLLRLKYQIQNGMWRLQLNREVPEVLRGLRTLKAGKLGRSPYVAVFSRIKNSKTIRLNFHLVRSKEFKSLKHRSLSLGTIGRTSARAYGWF